MPITYPPSWWCEGLLSSCDARLSIEEPLTMLHESAVAYDGLPISSGGAHSLGRLTSRQAYRAWRRFLDECAHDEHVEVYFDLPHTPSLRVKRDVVRTIARAFGKPAAFSKRIDVPLDRAEEALLVLESIEPQPTNP